MTPAYVYDLDALREHVSAIRAVLPDGLELLYAMKANPAAELLETLAPYVDGFEAASGGELIHLARVLPEQPAAAFGGPGKTDTELKLGLELGVSRFHVESPFELQRLSALGGEADVMLRVNLPVTLEGAALVMGGVATPFGMSPREAIDCARMAGVNVRGVHAHLASGLDAQAAAVVARRIVRWAVSTLDAREVNVGGGMAVDYTRPDDLFDWASYGQALAKLRREHPGVTIRIEPGRALTAYCGWYLTEVLDVKRAGGRWFAVVSGGTHHMRTPAAKGHSQPLVVIPRERWDRPYERPTARGEVTVVGQLCTPKDVLARNVPVDRIAVGDTVAFRLAGAYAWNISHRDFLMHPRPRTFTRPVAEVLAHL